MTGGARADSREWDAATYHKVSEPQVGWGKTVLHRLATLGLADRVRSEPWADETDASGTANTAPYGSRGQPTYPAAPSHGPSGRPVVP